MNSQNKISLALINHDKKPKADYANISNNQAEAGWLK